MSFLFLWLSWFSRSVGFRDFQMSLISQFSDLSGSCVSWFAWCVGFCRFHVFLLFGFRGIWFGFRFCWFDLLFPKFSVPLTSDFPDLQFYGFSDFGDYIGFLVYVVFRIPVTFTFPWFVLCLYFQVSLIPGFPRSSIFLYIPGFTGFHISCIFTISRFSESGVVRNSEFGSKGLGTRPRQEIWASTNIMPTRGKTEFTHSFLVTSEIGITFFTALWIFEVVSPSPGKGPKATELCFRNDIYSRGWRG